MTETENLQTVGAREIAVHVLREVMTGGAFAAAALNVELSRFPNLDVRDRALATELCYGVLRTWRVLEERLMQFAPRGLGPAGDTVRLELLVAAYQLLLLDRVPAYAVVHDTVERVSRVANRQVGGFVNALLRKVSTSPRLKSGEAIEATTPPWLLAGLTEAVGRNGALELLGVGTFSETPDGVPAEGGQRPEVVSASVRLRLGAAEPEWLEGAERGRLVPECYRVRGIGQIQRKPEYQRGEIVEQEEGALFCAKAVGVRASDRVLDACAGRGQKSSYLAEQLSSEGSLVVTDRGGSKLGQLRKEFERQKLSQPEVVPFDWSRPNAPFSGALFDRVLVDAPCTGTGTLRHRPEIALRLKEGDPQRLATLAGQILRNVLPFVKPGGRVVFVVCSVLT
jgi:16S rRNA (cytosine967-C5)-methyltransferase